MAGLLGAIFGGGGTGAIVAAVTRRRVTRAEAADQLTESAIDLLNTVKADARADLTAMRIEVAEARREANEARRTIRQASAEAEVLTAYLSRVVSAIHDPTMTMERLRLLVGNNPPNGTPRLSPTA